MENVSIGRAWNSIQIEFISVDNRLILVSFIILLIKIYLKEMG